jgi:hypothetical protein
MWPYLDDPSLPSLDFFFPMIADFPILNSENWSTFFDGMETLFYASEAEYMIGATSSTIIPPDCSFVDSQFYSLLMDRVDVQFRSLIEDTSSGLTAWLILCHHHDPQPATSPDDSYASVRTSAQDPTPIIPPLESTIPSLESPPSVHMTSSLPPPSMHPLTHFNLHPCGSANTLKKDFPLSAVDAFKKHFNTFPGFKKPIFAVHPPPSDDFEDEIYLSFLNWLGEPPGPGPPLSYGLLFWDPLSTYRI